MKKRCIVKEKEREKDVGLRGERERSDHLFQKSVAIFSKLDIAGSSNKPAKQKSQGERESERESQREREREREKERERETS